MKMNLGCGFDIKEGWINVDIVDMPGVEYWDMRTEPRQEWIDKFEYILINHTLCLLTYDDVTISLSNVRKCLSATGTLEIIDMDTLKAFKNHQDGINAAFPGFKGPIDSRLCKHLVGHGRQSLWTSYSLYVELFNLGFSNIKEHYLNSEHDLRPIESFIVKANK